MTESEWLACIDPTPMLVFLWGKASERKLRLFACAAALDLQQYATDRAGPSDILAIQDLVDAGTIDYYQTETYISEIPSPLVGTFYNRPQPTAPPYVTIGSFVRPGTMICLVEALSLFNELWAEEYGIVFDTPVANMATVEYSQVLFRVLPLPAVDGSHHRRGARADLLRDIVGNPFRLVTVDPSWLTSTVLALANGVYQDRAFDRLPILADALEDAGCDSADMLEHLHGDGPHVRGCWVVDLLVGKE
jgi:biotin carboxyl carrier protein